MRNLQRFQPSILPSLWWGWEQNILLHQDLYFLSHWAAGYYLYLKSRHVCFSPEFTLDKKSYLLTYALTDYEVYVFKNRKFQKLGNFKNRKIIWHFWYVLKNYCIPRILLHFIPFKNILFTHQNLEFSLACYFSQAYKRKILIFLMKLRKNKLPQQLAV